MKEISGILLTIHIIAGAISIILFWLPVIAKKGSRLHNKSGIIYVYSMTVVVISALLLSVKNVYIHHYEPAAFLGHLTILTSYPLWYGLRIVKHKKTLSDGFIFRRRLFVLTLTLSSMGLLVYAYFLDFQGAAILMTIFALLGLVNIKDLFRSKHKTSQASAWIIDHLRGMIVSGIAAYTAFLAFGGSVLLGHIFTGHWMIIPWMLPTVVGVLIIEVMKRRYKRS